MQRNWLASAGRKYRNTKEPSKCLGREDALGNILDVLAMAPIDSRLEQAAVLVVSRDL